MSIGGGDAALSPGLSVTCSEAELLTWMKILPGMSRPTEAAPEDVGIFLKTPLRLLHVLQGTPDENLDPLDRVVAALRWRILLEGTALGFMDRRLAAWSLLWLDPG